MEGLCFQTPVAALNQAESEFAGARRLVRVERTPTAQSGTLTPSNGSKSPIPFQRAFSRAVLLARSNAVSGLRLYRIVRTGFLGW
jgi:hypothetical protein